MWVQCDAMFYVRNVGIKVSIVSLAWCIYLSDEILKKSVFYNVI